MNTYNSYYPRNSAIKDSSISKVVGPLIGLGLFLAGKGVPGTGGIMSLSSLETLHNQIYEPQYSIEFPNTNKIDQRSPAELVEFIRKVFTLNMSGLAVVLNVTRPTIYAWLEGQEPKPEMLNRIRHISQLANKLQSLNIPRIDIVARRPIFDGYSLLDKLKNNEEVFTYLPVLKEIADKEEQARQIIKGPSKHKRSFSEVASDYSTPLYKND